MTTTTDPTAPFPSRAWTGEKVAWWIAFGVLTFSLVAMLGLWD